MNVSVRAVACCTLIAVNLLASSSANLATAVAQAAGPEIATTTPNLPTGEQHVYLPIAMQDGANSLPPDTDPGGPVVTGPEADWPQLGRDPQRTNASKVQVDPPFCYAWKWFQVPFASRAQPVVASGILYLGSMDGKLYARDAKTGAPKWSFQTEGAIRHSAGVAENIVVVSSYDGLNGSTYALDAATGALKWKSDTGPSATAPLIHPSRLWVYIASANNKLTALDLKTGAQKWQKDFGAPLLTSPSLSTDGKIIFFGSEDIKALAVDAGTGDLKWQSKLQGQSLAERYPVVAGDTVMYRSQPLYFFQSLLQQWGDEVMDQAGSVAGTADADWQKVKPKIVSHLTANPDQQTFFALNASDGKSRGVAPMLYTYGHNDIANMPVVVGGTVYVTYRARRGIQTDTPTVHVSTQYDAELGNMSLNTLDITSVKANKLSGSPEWRMTSDEPAMLTAGGNTLWVDSWERVGGLNLRSGTNMHGGAIGNPAAGCNEYCGGTERPFFPLSGNGPSWPFPATISGEGEARAGAVIASGMVYWRVLGGGLAAIKTQAGGSCGTPTVWGPSAAQQTAAAPPQPNAANARALTDYVNLDLTTPKSNPPADLVERVRGEVRQIVTSGGHLMPFYMERGFSDTLIWPRGTAKSKDEIPHVGYEGHGNAFWFDPSELMYTLAMAYPYLDADLQQQAKAYMAEEIKRYPVLESLPYNQSDADWLRTGVSRERYNVPMRSKLNNWPVSKMSLSALYGVWLWSKNTGDWAYACSNSTQIKSLYDEQKGNVRYYADMAGVIGYARLSQALSQRNCGGWSSTDSSASQADAASVLQAGLDYAAFQTRARGEYLDPRELATGWSLPELYGLTPEIGLYLSEQTGGTVRNEIAQKESGAGLRWWWFTRAGMHAEEGESSTLAPNTAWSHFLGRAYVVKDNQATLRKWLDLSWGKGDLYAIQKLVATIQAP